jgi:hypothetical protein
VKRIYTQEHGIVFKAENDLELEHLIVASYGMAPVAAKPKEETTIFRRGRRKYRVEECPKGCGKFIDLRRHTIMKHGGLSAKIKASMIRNRALKEEVERAGKVPQPQTW